MHPGHEMPDGLVCIPGPEMHSVHSSCFRQELNRKQEKGNTSSLSYLKNNHCFMSPLSKNLKRLPNRRKKLCLGNVLASIFTWFIEFI
jgi:hypothetical protein